jgi:hypothetical protein
LILPGKFLESFRRHQRTHFAALGVPVERFRSTDDGKTWTHRKKLTAFCGQPYHMGVVVCESPAR